MVLINTNTTVKLHYIQINNTISTIKSIVDLVQEFKIKIQIGKIQITSFEFCFEL